MSQQTVMRSIVVQRKKTSLKIRSPIKNLPNKMAGTTINKQRAINEINQRRSLRSSPRIKDKQSEKIGCTFLMITF